MSYLELSTVFSHFASSADILHGFNNLRIVSENGLTYSGGKFKAWCFKLYGKLTNVMDIEFPENMSEIQCVEDYFAKSYEYTAWTATLVGSEDDEADYGLDLGDMAVNSAPASAVEIRPVAIGKSRTDVPSHVVNEQEKSWGSIKTLDDLDDEVFDVIAWINTHLGDLKTYYDIPTICRSIISVAINQKMYRSSHAVSGSKINDIGHNHLIVKALEGDRTLVQSIVQGALQDNREKIEIAKVHVAKEEFSHDLRVVGDVVYNGKYFLNGSLSPLLQFKTKDVNWETNEALRSVMMEVSMLVTTTGFVRQVTVPVIKGVDVSERIWTLSSHLESYFDGIVKDVYSTVVNVTRRLVAAKISTITGSVGKQILPLMTFVKICAASHEDSVSDIKWLLKFWRSLRQGTIIDMPYFKHEYLFSKCGDHVLPYYATATKFLEAYNQLIPLVQQIANLPAPRNTVAVVYGGVTNNGDNVQLGAVTSFFEKFFGERMTNVHEGFDASKRWDLIKCDIHGQREREVIAIDAASLESVMSLSPRLKNFDHVIVVLDIADSSVGETTNVGVSSWMENFAQLGKVRFITSKYSSAHPLTISGFSSVLPLTSENVDLGLKDKEGNTYSFPVGRTHGIEGIIFGVPKRANEPRLKEVVMPFATVSAKHGCAAYRSAMKKRINIGSFGQFAPKTFRVFPEEDTYYESKLTSRGAKMVLYSYKGLFPLAYHNVGKLKQTGKEIASSVSTLFAISEITFELSDEDKRSGDNVKLERKAGNQEDDE